MNILDIPDVRKQVAPITIDRYHRMIDLGVFDEWNVELLDGVLVEKMSQSELHIFVVQFLFQQLSRHCPESTYLVRKEDPITIGNSEPEPDLSVVKGSLAEFRSAKPTSAELVIEVAITSLPIDRAKAHDYARARIPEYWIILPASETIEVYRNPRDGSYTDIITIPAGTTVKSSALPNFSFNLSIALHH